MTAVVFDVGETLVDETHLWERVADEARVPRFTLMAPGGSDFYPDALPCLGALRDAGYRLGAAGNMPESFEQALRAHVDATGSSRRWRVGKPDAGFFAQVAAMMGEPPERIAYVGDRVDNDVVPALAAGMVAVHVRRGPWGHLHDPPPGTPQVRSLAELPELLADA